GGVGGGLGRRGGGGGRLAGGRGSGAWGGRRGGRAGATGPPVQGPAAGGGVGGGSGGAEALGASGGVGPQRGPAQRREARRAERGQGLDRRARRSLRPRGEKRRAAAGRGNAVGRLAHGAQARLLRGPAAGRNARVRPGGGPVADSAGAAEQLNGAGKLSVLVVDDHAVVQWGFRLLLGRQHWIGRCEAATTPEEAVELARRLKPDVALVDLFLGERSG